MITQDQNLTDQQLIDSGYIAFGYLREDQLDLYDLLLNHKNPFIECARRYGKTTSVLCHVLEKLLKNPGWVVRWCEPYKNQCRDIVQPEIEKIQKCLPREWRFRYQTTDSVYIGPYNSRMYLRGVGDDRGESARGPTSNIIVADEFGSWKNADYVVNDILRPQLLTTRGQFIFMSSPASDLAHPYYEHKARALTEGRFIQRTILDNPTISPEDIEMIATEVGGKDTASFRREYMCEPVSDAEALVIPEFNESVHIYASMEHPPYRDCYIGLDLGLNDCTAALFGYWDFLERRLVIEDEYVINGKNTGELVEAFKAKEANLWPSPPYRRVGDNDLQQLHDMASMFNYAVWPTKKDDKLAALNALRLRFSSGKILISERCKNLIFQLKVGLWNDRRTDFKRGERTGHLDAIDALIYLSRNIDEHHNPYPQYKAGTSFYTHHLPAPIQNESDQLAELFSIDIKGLNNDDDF